MSFLFPKPKMDKAKLDTSLVEPAIRGTLLPISLGVNRVSPIIGYVGATQITQESVGSAGGKGGGGGDITQDVYHQVGLHFLSIGKGVGLSRIMQGGKQIWPDPKALISYLTPSNAPSGTSISVPHEGTFRIYWGESNQPVDSQANTGSATSVASLTGILSAFPYVMYVVWDRKVLGQRKQWPNLEYEIMVVPQQTSLFGHSPVYDLTTAPQIMNCNISSLAKILVGIFGGYYVTGGAITTTDTDAAKIKKGWIMTGTVNGIYFTTVVTNVTLVGSTYTIATQTLPPGDWLGHNNQSLTFYDGVQRGINPIAVLYQLLFETYPHGLGLPTDMFNLTDMSTLFTYFDDSATRTPSSIYLTQGKSIKDGISQVMQDCGILMGWDCATNKYRFVRPLDTDTATEISVGQYSFSDSYMETDYSVLDPEIMVYNYKDANRKFTDSTILLTSDGRAGYTDMPNAKKTSLDTVRDITTASRVAAYRDRENAHTSTLSVTISKALLTAQVGGLFSFAGFPGKFRLMEKTVTPDVAGIKCEFYEDAYSEPSPYEAKEPSGYFPEDAAGAEQDLLVRLLEINRFIKADINGVSFLRIRQHPTIAGMMPFLSANDITYNQYAQQSYSCTGGNLTQAMTASGPAIITAGPQFEVLGPDINTVMDLSSTDSKPFWKGGMQLALIDNELFYLKGVTPVGGLDATYTLDGLIRARLGTARAAHSIGASVIIFRMDALTLLSPSFLSAGHTVYGKSDPYTSVDVVDISDINAVNVAYKGGGFRPLPPVNLATADRTNGFVSGTAVSLVWGYRNVIGGAGAGLGLSDEAYHCPLPEGYFRLEFRTTGDTLVRTVDNLTTPNYTYSDANRIADFGGGSFKVRVYNVLNGLVSDYCEITMTT